MPWVSPPASVLLFALVFMLNGTHPTSVALVRCFSAYVVGSKRAPPGPGGLQVSIFGVGS